MARRPGDDRRLAGEGVLDENRLGDYLICGLDAPFFSEDGELRSVFDRWPETQFSSALVSSAIVLFDHPWSAALLSRIYKAVAPGGDLIVPVAPRRAGPRRTGPHISRERLETLFGPGQPCANRKYMSFPVAGAEPPGEADRPRSVLDWYWSRYSEVAFNAAHNARLAAAFETLAAGRGEDKPQDRLPAELRSFIVSLKTGDGARAPNDEDGAPGIDSDVFATSGAPARPTDSAALARAVGGQSYTIAGLRYKAPILAEILRAEAPARALDLTDVGGGYGAMAAELLLDPQAPVARILVNDVSALYLAYATHFRRALAARFAGAFTFALAPMAEFDFPETDVVTFIGSLLFAPKDRLAAILERAFMSLRPGGLLIVHENIKLPHYQAAKEYDIMFAARDLDKALGRFGDIVYYASTSADRLSPGEVGDQTVFRIVKK